LSSNTKTDWLYQILISFQVIESRFAKFAPAYKLFVYDKMLIITVCYRPIGCAVTNLAVSESIFVLIHKGNTANLFIGISK